MRHVPFVLAVASLLIVSCGQPGPPGPSGTTGATGAAGPNGGNGSEGMNGEGGTNADSGTPLPPVPPTDGTRIKSRTATTTITTTTSDGAKSVVSYPSSYWFDTLRNERCAFQAAGDGKTRCIPAGSALTDYSSGAYFSDSLCTQALALTFKPASASCGGTVLPAPTAPVYFGTNVVANGCGGVDLRPIGTLITPSPATVYVKSGVNCFSTASTSSYQYFTAGGATIAPTEFVESTTTTITM